jgi:Fur family transcriptional regulator, zinc uptake regulator
MPPHRAGPTICSTAYAGRAAEPAPPTVYRTLDFLLDQGLIHKIERLSAFVGCVAGCTADPGEEAHTHSVQFLICCKCGKVIELRNRDVSAGLAQAAQEIGFAINGATVEAEGLCSTCQSPAMAV